MQFCSARSCGFFGSLIKRLCSSSLQQKHRHRLELELQRDKLEILHCRADSFQCRISNNSKSCGIFYKNKSDHGYRWRPEAAKKEMMKYFWWTVSITKIIFSALNFCLSMEQGEDRTRKQTVLTQFCSAKQEKRCERLKLKKEQNRMIEDEETCWRLAKYQAAFVSLLPAAHDLICKALLLPLLVRFVPTE